jgi:hypothetical protein
VFALIVLNVYSLIESYKTESPDDDVPDESPVVGINVDTPVRPIKRNEQYKTVTPDGSSRSCMACKEEGDKLGYYITNDQPPPTFRPSKTQEGKPSKTFQSYKIVHDPPEPPVPKTCNHASNFKHNCRKNGVAIGFQGVPSTLQ